GPPADRRRDDLRGRPDPDRGAGAAVEGDRPLVPVRRVPLPFLRVLNLVGFVPLPLSNDKFHIGGVTLPTWGIYAATAQLSVTLTLAILSVLFTHIEGVRNNGVGKYLKSFVPEGVPKVMVPFMAL